MFKDGEMLSFQVNLLKKYLDSDDTREKVEVVGVLDVITHASIVDIDEVVDDDHCSNPNAVAIQVPTLEAKETVDDEKIGSTLSVLQTRN